MLSCRAFVNLDARGVASTLTGGPAHFLLVGLPADVYQRELGRHGIVTIARTAAEAIAMVTSLRLSGIVAVLDLPDGSAFDVARAARAYAPELPILVVADDATRERLAVSLEVAAAYVLAPLEPHQVALFASRATARQQRGSILLKDWIDRYALSAAEAVTLRLALDGLRREEIAEARGVGLGTAKNQIHTLLSKLSKSSLAEAVAAFYWELAAPPT